MGTILQIVATQPTVASSPMKLILFNLFATALSETPNIFATCNLDDLATSSARLLGHLILH